MKEEEEREGEDEEESLDVGVGWSQTMTLHGRSSHHQLIQILSLCLFCQIFTH